MDDQEEDLTMKDPLHLGHPQIGNLGRGGFMSPMRWIAEAV